MVCIEGQCTATECVGSEDCGALEMCAAGQCVPIADAGPLPDADGTTLDGEPCTRSAECVHGLCLPAARGGVCSQPCADASACFATVTFSSACGPADVDGTRVTACLPIDVTGRVNGTACTTDAQCAGQTCSEGLCTEACDADTDCLAGERCQGTLPWSGGTFSGCGYPARVGAVEILEIDLGTRSLSGGAGTSGLSFGVPSDAISVTLRAEHVSGALLDLAFYTATSPGGASLYSLSEFSDLIDQPIRWYPVDGGEAINMLVPNATPDRFAFEIGRYPYGLVAFGSGSTTVRLSVLVKRAAGRTVSSGTLDLAIHLVGVGLTAASAPANSRVVAMLSRMNDILRQVGVSLGTITYHDVSTADAAALAVIDSVDGTDSELAQLFRLSAGRTGRVLPLFLVRGIDAGGDGFNTLGIAGGIPGTSAIYGTENSGVVVAFDSGVVSGTAAGHIAAHECSHFLGLFHVTERLRACGAGESPSAGTCSPFGATDVINDTTPGDRTNLMHWSIQGGGTNTGVSAGQGFVYLRSPLVR
jgi:hypothetical protein